MFRLGKQSADGRRSPKAVRSPTVLQMEAVECGAAALAIVLAHFGRWVPLEELRIACGVSRDGSKASNIIKAARQYGLEAKGFKHEPKNLRTLNPPAILHWNFNHFVVLDGFHKGRVRLNDPAIGPKVVTEEELDQAFTGVVLTFKAAPGFERQGDPPRLLPALQRRLAGSQAALLFVLLAGLALVIPGLAVPVFSKVFVDSVLLEGRQDWLRPLLLAMGSTALLLGALTWLQQSYLLRLETRMAVGASSRFLWHVLRLPVEFFSQRYAGDISARVGINDRVAQLLSRDLATNMLGALMIVFFAAVLFLYDPVLTGIGILIALLNVAALRFVSRKRVDGNRRFLQDQGKMMGTALGGLQTIETLKATGSESDLFARWAGYQAKVVNARQDLERYTQLLDAVPPLLGAVNTALILGIGGLRVMNGTLSVGGLLAFQLLMASFMGPINRLVSLGGRLQMVEGDMNRLDDVLRYRVDESAGLAAEESVPPDEPVKLAGWLELRDVSFGYSRLDPPLIEGLSLTVRPGARIALVGGSGSGKSTVARLVTGLHKPWSGEILFDGRSRSARQGIPPRVLANSLAAVDQSLFLFKGTVRENLTLWDSTVPLPEVIAAARDAGIHEEIASRPGGYDSPVEEGGANWSGGQRQRLEIARALMGRPSILILDEATSALDPTTEQLIDASLRRRGCTCLIIAHRLSTIRDADEILVLERGKVVQRGTHEELRGVEGPYSRLIQAE
ncbi:MAG TPA: NHLP family bacteriocin export ABC transporter peptidase/permease/ATPase subunit [Thermoanaerobaculia bacterium]|jgi:NHLM bacteriocin system ABC transporter peptidase/ATP-binding protein|nr:NHLP family bacteriocin export ABC transporter peptidase/permease/ATPase subunit [Thermoanaerobaculia bacterium]